MASQTVYACDIPLDASGVCLGNSIAFTVDSDLGEALNNHALALQANIVAMDDFFTISTEDVSLISAGFFVIFIIGHSAGKVAKMMRNT